MQTLTDTQSDIIRVGVNIAKQKQISSVASLKSTLSKLGYKTNDIDKALLFWANSINKES